MTIEPPAMCVTTVTHIAASVVECCIIIINIVYLSINLPIYLSIYVFIYKKHKEIHLLEYISTFLCCVSEFVIVADVGFFVWEGKDIVVGFLFWSLGCC